MPRTKQGDILKVLGPRYPSLKRPLEMSKSGRIVFIHKTSAFVDFGDNYLSRVFLEDITMTRHGWTVNLINLIFTEIVHPSIIG